MLLHRMMCHFLFFCLSHTQIFPMKCVCVEENISHICRVYADERRCMCIHTTTGSVYKGRFINHLGKRVSLKNHGQWTQQQHREMTTTSMAFLETPDCILMSVQTLHRNECITVHLIFFFSIYFFGVDLLPVVQERKVSTEDKTVSDMWQTGACAVQERWSNMTKVTFKKHAVYPSDYIFICRVF